MPPKKRIRCDDSSSKTKEKPKHVFHDPIGNHVIALRTYYRDLVNHSKKLKQRKSPGPIPLMPEYPTNYPTPEFLSELRKRRHGIRQRLVFKAHISEIKLEEIRTFAIKRILLQIGFDVEDMDNNDNALVHFSHVLDTFLQSFVDRMRCHKDSEVFCNTENIWNPLETTLQEWGFDGVSGIARYFYCDFVKMHDALYNDCIKKQLQVMNAKPPVKRKRKKQVNEDMPNSSPVIVNCDGNELDHDPVSIDGNELAYDPENIYGNELAYDAINIDGNELSHSLMSMFDIE